MGYIIPKPAEWLWNWAAGGGWGDFEEHARESLNHCEHSVNKNMDFEDTAAGGSEEVVSHGLGNWRKRICVHVVVRYLVITSLRLYGKQDL